MTSRSIMSYYKKIESETTSTDHCNSSHKTHTSNKRNSSKIQSCSKCNCIESTVTGPVDVYDSNFYASSSWLLPPELLHNIEKKKTKTTLTSHISGGDSTITSSSVTMSPSADNTSTKDKLSTVIYKHCSVEPILIKRCSPTATQTSQHVAVKRKRTVSLSCSRNDNDLDSESPSAKRKQLVPSPYKSEGSSVVSSTYPSPVDAFVNEIDTRSSLDCLSAAADYETVDDIPDSPSSIQNADEEMVSETTSPSASSVASSHLYRIYSSNHGERTPCQNYCDSNTNETNDTQSKLKSLDFYPTTHYNCMTPATETEMPRQCPLPALSWANADDVWQLMCKKDEEAACLRTILMLERHPSLQPRMRAILLDWLIEVCEVYKLHRETYYLALDYLDRYLSVQKNVQKTHLQLIGITCLFVAAKVEEIYPPKIGEFAYVTDGACQESDILQQEVLLLQSLEWSINPVTPMGWLGVFMQLNVNNRTPASLTHNTTKSDTSTALCKPMPADDVNSNNGFIYPQFSSMEFVQTAQLLDLCSLDVGIAEYPYSVIAAAAMSHTFNRETALRCSGFDWQAIELCARWMGPFFSVVREESEYLQLAEQNDQVTTRFGLSHICPNIITDDSHIIQTHTTTMAMFNRSTLMREQNRIATKIKQEASPAASILCSDGPLTPPASSRKPVDTNDTYSDESIKLNTENVKYGKTATTAATKISENTLVNEESVLLT